jgi:hypothetical protein
MRTESFRFLLLGGLVVLSACTTGSSYVNPASRLTYACYGAQNMISYSACDRPSDNKPSQGGAGVHGGMEPPGGNQ